MASAFTKDHLTASSATNYQRYRAAYNSVPTELRGDFDNYFIGGISVWASPEAIDRAVAGALKLINRASQQAVATLEKEEAACSSTL